MEGNKPAEMTSQVLAEPVAGAAPHFLGEDVAGAALDVVAEAVGRPGLLVGPGDGLDALADFLDRAAVVELAEVQVQRPRGDQARDVRRVAVLEPARE